MAQVRMLIELEAAARHLDHHGGGRRQRLVITTSPLAAGPILMMRIVRETWTKRETMAMVATTTRVSLRIG